MANLGSYKGTSPHYSRPTPGFAFFYDVEPLRLVAFPEEELTVIQTASVGKLSQALKLIIAEGAENGRLFEYPGYGHIVSSLRGKVETVNL